MPVRTETAANDGPGSKIERRYRCKTSSYRDAFRGFDVSLVSSLHAKTYSFRVDRRAQENAHMVFSWDSSAEQGEESDDDVGSVHGSTDALSRKSVPSDTPIDVRKKSKKDNKRIDSTTPTLARLATLDNAPLTVHEWDSKCDRCSMVTDEIEGSDSSATDSDAASQGANMMHPDDTDNNDDHDDGSETEERREQSERKMLKNMRDTMQRTSKPGGFAPRNNVSATAYMRLLHKYGEAMEAASSDEPTVDNEDQEEIDAVGYLADTQRAPFAHGKPPNKDNKKPFALYGWKSESKQTFNVSAANDNHYQVKESAVRAEKLASSPRRPSAKLKSSWIKAGHSSNDNENDSLASTRGSISVMRPAIESELVAHASEASTNGNEGSPVPVKMSAPLKSVEPEAKRPFALYGWKAAPKGFPLAKQKETFNVKANSTQVKKSALRAAAFKGLKVADTHEPKSHIKTSKKKNDTAKNKAPLAAVEDVSAPLIENRLVRAASVASTRGSANGSTVSRPQLVSSRRNPLAAVYAKLAEESKQRKGDWQTEYRKNYKAWPSKAPEFKRPCAANAPGGPHDPIIYPVGLELRARKYDDDNEIPQMSKAWR